MKIDDLPRPARIAEVIEESPRVKTFVLEAAIQAEPGQFIMVWLPGVDEKPFSLVDDNPLTLTVAQVGPFTTKMHESQAGDRVWFRGPLGRGFEVRGKHLLLVGGGYGVAPLAFLARVAADDGRRVAAVIGACTKDDLILRDRFQAPDCQVMVTTEDGSAGRPGLVTEAAEEVLARERVDAVYACGPEAMLKEVASLCQQYGVPGQLSREAYIRCGLGVCGSCQREGFLICRDGPVFSTAPSLPAFSSRNLPAGAGPRQVPR